MWKSENVAETVSYRKELCVKCYKRGKKKTTWQFFFCACYGFSLFSGKIIAKIIDMVIRKLFKLTSEHIRSEENRTYTKPGALRLELLLRLNSFHFVAISGE